MGIALSEGARKLCDRYRGASYAQFGEDRQILHYVPYSPSRYYVDIGCNFPDNGSNTYLLYQMGWNGLCVDGNQSIVKAFQEARPRDVVECACVGAEPGEIAFVITKDPMLSHVAGSAFVHPLADDEALRVTVPVKPLQQLFEEHSVPNRFGLLSIDVEGLDFAALRSFDIRKWRPYLILIEIHGLKLEECGTNEIVVFLRDAGYQLVGYCTFTAVFIDVEGSGPSVDSAAIPVALTAGN